MSKYFSLHAFAESRFIRAVLAIVSASAVGQVVRRKTTCIPRLASLAQKLVNIRHHQVF
jgi:hypothetical protein